jgi:hypothetical protein
VKLWRDELDVLLIDAKRFNILRTQKRNPARHVFRSHRPDVADSKLVSHVLEQDLSPLAHAAPPFPNGVGRTAADAAGASPADDPKASNDGRVLTRWSRRRMGLMGRIAAGLE